VLWVLRSGAQWADLPERYDKYKSAHKRFVRWANSDVWQRVFHELVGDKKNQYLMLDSTIVRARQQAAAGRKRGRDKALGRSRGGLMTKIHLLTNELCQPLDFLITGSQVNACAQAIEFTDLSR
jgi:putative transposase